MFSYSERPGTRALQIPYVVSPEQKHIRSQRLLALSEMKKRAFYQRFSGTCRPVLWEHGRPGSPLHGFTDNYLRVECAETVQMADNTLMSVRLGDFTSDGNRSSHIRLPANLTNPLYLYIFTMKVPKVAVVILNWNGEAMLRQFLPSVVQYSTEGTVVVADNGSDDGSADG